MLGRQTGHNQKSNTYEGTIYQFAQWGENIINFGKFGANTKSGGESITGGHRAMDHTSVHSVDIRYLGLKFEEAFAGEND